MTYYNMRSVADNPDITTPSEQRNGSGGAVGKRHWYIAVVRKNMEKNTRERMKEGGYETYVATQTEMHHYKCGHHKEVERVIIPSYVFVCCSEQERLRSLKEYPTIIYYMTDRATVGPSTFRRPVAIVPDEEMRMLMYMLYHADSPVLFTPEYVKGDRVRVARGPFIGREGVFVEALGRENIAVELTSLGTVMVKINKSDVVRI